MVKTFTMVLGVVLLLVGVLGFVLNPTDGNLLGIFAVNGPHNWIHVLSGILGIAAASMGFAKMYCQIFGIVYLLVAVLGLAMVGSEGMLLGLVHLNAADHVLHLAIGAASAYFGFAAQTAPTPARG